MLKVDHGLYLSIFDKQNTRLYLLHSITMKPNFVNPKSPISWCLMKKNSAADCSVKALRIFIKLYAFVLS